MTKRQKPFLIQLQSEGSGAQRALEREELQKEARRLADGMPTFGPERLIYVRNLTTKALQGKVDVDMFKAFLNMTNSWEELETCLPRAEQIVRRGSV